MFRNLKTTSLLQSQLKADPLEGNLGRVSRTVLNSHYSFVAPEKTPEPKLLSWSSSCALDCLDIKDCDKQQVESVLSGNESLAPGIKSWSLAYAGHQFGHFAGQLGDGRAISLAQIINSRNEIWEIQLKGAGLTPYSRSADGYAVLRSSIREFLCSEHMHHLGIPTSRALSLISSSRIVYRETAEQGAIVSRLAPSWIRFGSFELAFYRKEEDTLEMLANYVINNFYPAFAPNDYIGFFKEVLEQTASMLSDWQAFGFCHGVMNTDNFSILGITIDYGPFAFMDEFDPNFVCNHSDELGMYSYANQPRAALFNLFKLATSLVPLFSKQLNVDNEKVHSTLLEILDTYMPSFELKYYKKMSLKLGLAETNAAMVKSCLEAMKLAKVDYTLFFRFLSDYKYGQSGDFIGKIKPKKPEFIVEWLKSYEAVESYHEDRSKKMKTVNPRYVLRNGLVQKIINDCERGDCGGIDEYKHVLMHPFEDGALEQQIKFGSLLGELDTGIKCSCSS